MRLTRKLNPPYEKVYGEDYVYTSETRLTPSFACVEQKLGKLENIEELCEKISKQVVYYKYFDGSIRFIDFTNDPISYSFTHKCIMILKHETLFSLEIDEYGIYWTLTKEELEK